MEPLRTYEDKLREDGMVVPTEDFKCPECPTTGPAFTIVEVSPGRWICSACHISQQEQIQAAAAAAIATNLLPWDTDEGYQVRAVRTRLQERWRWGVMPDSPLHAEAQARVMAFLKSLNTLTVTFTKPEDVVWPNEPVITAEDYDA